MRTIKAWAFLVGEKGKEYLITDLNGKTEIYLKKPEPRANPFDYQHKGWKWKPTRIVVTKPSGGEVHLCPNCYGQKTISKPRWVAGDQTTWVNSSTELYCCPTCNGVGYLITQAT